MELKSCPFCGSNDVETYRFMQITATNRQYVWCRACYAHGPIMPGAAKAVELWNQRPSCEPPRREGGEA